MPGTVFETFAETAGAAADHPFLIVPARADREWHPDGVAYSYGAALAEVERLRDLYAAAGYGHGHRVSILLENRPEFFFHYLALNAIGACIVPVNPDYRHDEVAYLLDHSEVELAVVLPHRVADVAKAAERAKPLPVVDAHAMPAKLPAPVPTRAALRHAGPGKRMLAALYVRHDGAAQGLSAVEPLYAERRRDLSQLRRADRHPARPGAVLQSAAAVPHQSPQHHVDGGDADRQYPGAAGAFFAVALVARGFHPRRHDHPLPRHRRADAAEPAAVPRRPGAQGSLRHRRGHRAATAQRVRGALRLPHDRGVGHDRDGAHHGRQPRAAHDRHARLRAAVPGIGSARRRRSRPGRARRQRRRAHRAPFGREAAATDSSRAT